ncbi:MAG: hypothetical protein AVO33_01500 [delta proteobacterium ML8_F1]|nr:MAG: hypothetical protein AVO33_01500 [delta proteobacterium ML8_F1]
MFERGFVGGDLYLEGAFKTMNLYTDQGKIAAISGERLPCRETVDCRGLKVLPGFIDPHVHFALNLGEFTSADDFESGSISGAFGGVTTFIDFLDPVLEAEAFHEKLAQRKLFAQASRVDYSFHTTLGHFSGDVQPLINASLAAGLTSVKVFTTYSESRRDCPKPVIEALLRSPLTVLSHTEKDDLVDPDWLETATYEASRPVKSETLEALALADLVEKTGGSLYMVHTSAGSTVKALEEHYGHLLGRQFFLETCPQYLHLNRDCFKGKEGPLYLLAPPLRSPGEQALLKDRFSSIYSIGTDHCPFMRAEKLRYPEASKVPKGIGGIEYSFLLLYELFGDEVIDRFTSHPATLFHLKHKGALRVGMDADLNLLDPQGTTLAGRGHSKSDYSPYEGKNLKGRIRATYLRGEPLVIGDRLYPSQGNFLRRRLD